MEILKKQISVCHVYEGCFLKTKIITLESHDDLISVRDKLSWAKTPRILLVWTKYARVNLRLIDLKVLQRHADALGAQLGIVTRRLNVRRDAESLGIPVFKSTSEAQKKSWGEIPQRGQFIPKPPRKDLRAIRDSIYEKEPAWRTSLAGRVIAFSLGVAAVLALAVIFLPRAGVTIRPPMQNQSAVIPIRAHERMDEVSITGQIPARRISVIVSASQSLALTKTIDVPKSKARGIARFTNLSQGEVIIPAGTVVATADEPRIKFVTLHETRLGTQNTFVDVPIEAVEAGEAGNVDAEKITTVEGLLGLTLTVNNPNPTGGGASVKQIGASDEDRARLRETVLDNLRREAETKLRGQISPDDVFLDETIEMISALEEKFTPLEGMPGKTLTLDMQIEFSALYLSAQDLNALALAVLDSSMPARFTPARAPQFEILTPPAFDSLGMIAFDMKVSRPLIEKQDVMSVFAISRGKSIARAKLDLRQSLNLREDPQIIISPAWWKWMPLIPLNVKVNIE